MTLTIHGPVHLFASLRAASAATIPLPGSNSTPTTAVRSCRQQHDDHRLAPLRPLSLSYVLYHGYQSSTWLRLRSSRRQLLLQSLSPPTFTKLTGPDCRLALRNRPFLSKNQILPLRRSILDCRPD
ncbi:hypothetical protein IWZ01DRAFT_502914 [Phyllosticta capitalensis]